MGDPHPAPWRWGTNGDDWLRAANDEIVIEAGDGCTWPADAYVGELVRAAPEMEQALSTLVDYTRRSGADPRWCCEGAKGSPGDAADGHDEDCKRRPAIALLEKIREAKIAWQVARARERT